MSAYADALAAAGRDDEAATWLEKAADADLDGSMGAAERLGRVDDGEIYDLLEDERLRRPTWTVPTSSPRSRTVPRGPGRPR